MTGGKQESRFWSWMSRSGVLWTVALGSYAGSLTHWLRLAVRNGQGGLAAWFISACVDLLALQAARERQNDAKVGRGPRFGIVSWPAVVMIFSVVVTLAGNAFTAKPTAGGVLLAIFPGVALLISISFMERRAAEEGRRQKAARQKAERQEAEERARREEEEREQRCLAEAGRLRQEAARAEAGRQAERERQRHEREERRRLAGAERHGAVSPSSGGNVTAGVTAGGLHAVPPSEARANSPERRAMWGFWVHAIKQERRIPSGEELRAAGGCNEGSAAGRIAAKQWRQIEPAASLLRDQEASGRKEATA